MLPDICILSTFKFPTFLHLKLSSHSEKSYSTLKILYQGKQYLSGRPTDMAEKAEGMNALNEVTAGAKVGQAEGYQQTANSGKAEEEGRLNEVNSLIANTS